MRESGSGKDGAASAAAAIREKRYRIAVHVPEGGTAHVAGETDLVIGIHLDPTVPAEFVSSVEYTIEAAVMDARGEELRSRADRLGDRMEELRDRIVDLRDRIDDLRSTVDTLETDLEQCANANARLATQLETVLAAIPGGGKGAPPHEVQSAKGWRTAVDAGASKAGPEAETADAAEDEGPEIDMDRGIGVSMVRTGGDGRKAHPNTVQQNVPGWTIFALFWIAQIIALSMISERASGSWTRILVAPIPAAAVVAGKVIPFMAINLVQAAFMFAIGVHVLPLAGCPELELGDPAGLAIMTLATSLAAIGLGFLMSSISRASMLVASATAVLLIVMAVMGGIMIPKFVMPGFMQDMSVLVPQGWALEGYLDVLVCGRSALDVLPHACVLAGFAVAFFLVALLRIRRLGRAG